MSNAGNCQCSHAGHPGHVCDVCECEEHEPAPQPEPSGETAEQMRTRLGWPPLTDEQKRANLEQNLQSLGVAGGERREPEPSGDEAKVREIVERWVPGEVSGDARDLCGIALHGAVREAYADGKADGAREEREALGKLIDGMSWNAATDTMADRLRDAIARRGSEGT